MHERRRIRLNQPQNGAALLVYFTPGCVKNAYAIRQIAKRGSYRLEKKGDDRYRLINARFNRHLSTRRRVTRKDRGVSRSTHEPCKLTLIIVRQPVRQHLASMYRINRPSGCDLGERRAARFRFKLTYYRASFAMRFRPCPLHRGQRTSSSATQIGAFGSRRLRVKSKWLIVSQLPHATISQ